MIEQLEITSFLEEAQERIILDVRSPGEYKNGHIPNAINFPLFSDDERAQVGKLYKASGQEAALELGLELIGSRMVDFIRNAKKIAPKRDVLVHCWRGGKRSQSMAWLLRTAGFKVNSLKGGYKVFRKEVLHYFATQTLKLCVVGGRTGVGKTAILHSLRKEGAQIIDLEALANHKGSAFGSLGEENQPRTEHFENMLYHKLQELDHNKVIYVENESRMIGHIVIPEGFWKSMKSSLLINIELPFDVRVQRLVTDYSNYEDVELIASFYKIKKRLAQQLKVAEEAIKVGDYTTAASIALGYYDKAYQHGLEKSLSPRIVILKFENFDIEAIKKQIISNNIVYENSFAAKQNLNPKV